MRAAVFGGLTLALFASAASGADGMRLSSAAFGEGQPIPRPYTCEGRDVSPPLAWDGVPAGAKSLALIVDDPDAPDPAAPRVIWVHWVLYNLPASAGGLSEAVATGALPPGTLQGINDWGRAGYGGPCPPVGRHRYFFKLYALDSVLPDLQQPSKAAVMGAMHGHVMGESHLTGTYRKGQ
jgi:Raf kinase inhibitor-like YbhB/YbcL family protein